MYAKPTGWYLIVVAWGVRGGLRAKASVVLVLARGVASAPVGGVRLVKGVGGARGELELRVDAVAAIDGVPAPFGDEHVPLELDRVGRSALHARLDVSRRAGRGVDRQIGRQYVLQNGRLLIVAVGGGAGQHRVRIEPALHLLDLTVLRVDDPMRKSLGVSVVIFFLRVGSRAASQRSGRTWCCPASVSSAPRVAHSTWGSFARACVMVEVRSQARTLRATASRSTERGARAFVTVGASSSHRLELTPSSAPACGRMGASMAPSAAYSTGASTQAWSKSH